jgi:hypothetical protein
MIYLTKTDWTKVCGHWSLEDRMPSLSIAAIAAWKQA